MELDTTVSNPAIRERVLDLVWSLWAGLGVSGWRRRHQGWGIDPEPLVVFTAWLQDLDPRLRDESIDWCITYGSYLSRARLRNLLRTADDEVAEAFGVYAATVNAHSSLTWPGATTARSYKPTQRSHLDDFTEPSLLALRLRALFGVGARPEIVRTLMPGGALAASDIADRIDYTKRNVAESLESLRLAGMVVIEARGNANYFRLNRREFRSAMTPLPKLFPYWSAIFRVVQVMLTVDAREEARTKATRSVEARTAVESVKSDVMSGGLKRPDTSILGEEFWGEFLRWGSEIAEGLAFAEPERAFEEGQVPSF